MSLIAPLNILHVFRAPVGGLFRHVLDLAREQIARGHRVGMIADSLTGGANADVVHGHGAKGGAYARLTCNARRAVRANTPHGDGGSLLFGHDSLAGKFYLATEKLLMLRGDLFLFESAYSEQIFRRKIGNPRGLVRVVHNGVSRGEFTPIVSRPDASDLVFMGELRPVKGIDVLIEAIAILKRGGRHVTATLVGSGPDHDALRAQVERQDLVSDISFKAAMPAREALTLGRVMGGAVAR